MTVKELMAELRKYPEDIKICDIYYDEINEMRLAYKTENIKEYREYEVLILE